MENCLVGVCGESCFGGESGVRVEDAIKSADQTGIGFFDLGFTSDDRRAISQIEIQNSKNIVLFGLNNLQNQAERFFEEFALPLDKNLRETAVHLSCLIVKIVANIMAVARFESAEVVLRTHHKSESGTYFPAWHIDKRDDEIIQPRPDVSYFDIQHVFILALHGESTLFQSMPLQARLQWNILANESYYAYGYDSADHYVSGHGLDEMFNVSESISAEFGQGSVHIAGHMNGTIHACPPLGDGRALVIITPGNFSTISGVQNLGIGLEDD